MAASSASLRDVRQHPPHPSHRRQGGDATDQLNPSGSSVGHERALLLATYGQFCCPPLGRSRCGRRRGGSWPTPETLGVLFESLVVRDRRVYGQAETGSVYRDSVGLEADAIMERNDGAWLAVEVKLSPSPQSVDAAAATLLRLRHKVALRRADDLTALLVVTSTGAAYRRKDGVQVAPITALGP